MRLQNHWHWIRSLFVLRIYRWMAIKKQIYVTLGNNMWVEAEKTKLRSRLRSKTLNEVSSNSRHERRKLSLATQ